MFLLVKVPVAFVLGLGFQRCVTPPNPPPPKEEQKQLEASLDGKGVYTASLPAIIGAINCVLLALESITIVASSSTNTHLHDILRLTVFTGGNPKHMSIRPLHALGATLLLTGIKMRLSSFQALGRFFRFETSIQQDHQLITTRPYTIVRHPSYTGMMIIYVGWMLWNLCEGSWVRECGILNQTWGRGFLFIYVTFGFLIPAHIMVKRTIGEDLLLKERFGSAWDDWAKEVPYKLLPYVY